jgi:predicted RNase H-like HicB family nuclease/uncharacterized damage-inducible protein DinB
MRRDEARATIQDPAANRARPCERKAPIIRFELYVETGPRHGRTMVHVPALAGCVATGPTTQEAIENARSAIRARIEFLRRHGEPVADPDPIELVVAEEDTTSGWLGFGVGFFGPDRAPIGADEAARQATWLTWSREELVAAARAWADAPSGPSAYTAAEPAPAGPGRTVGAILLHVADAERGYLNAALGPVPGLSAAVTAIERAADEPWEPLARARTLVLQRLAATTDEERAAVVQRGKGQRTVRRMLRRMLEHEWEHTLEIQARLKA